MKNRSDCNYHLTKHGYCTMYKGKCSLNRWLCGEDSIGRVISSVLFMALLAAFIYSVIWVACWSSDKTYAWSYEPGYVYGPMDWKEKEADCKRRAKILDEAYIEYVEDDRYCVVKIKEKTI